MQSALSVRVRSLMVRLGIAACNFHKLNRLSDNKLLSYAKHFTNQVSIIVEDYNNLAKLP